jgi:glycosyltransferase involved in cell wall biosynthesis
MSSLTLSVVVPTRNRPAHIMECVRSILATDGYADLIVIDQSDDTATQDGLSVFDDVRLRYLRTETRGVTKGRNLGMSLSRSDVIAFTDDDCRVRPEWPRRITELFSAEASAAVICGRVVVPDEIAQQGYAVGFEPQQRDWHRPRSERIHRALRPARRTMVRRSSFTRSRSPVIFARFHARPVRRRPNPQSPRSCRAVRGLDPGKSGLLRAGLDRSE